MGDMADYYGTDQMIDDIWDAVEKMELEEAKTKIDDLQRIQHLKLIDKVTRPRVSGGLTNLLGQSDAWINKAGEHVPLTSIDARYASNIMAWLVRRALAIKHRLEFEFLVMPEPGGDMATDDFYHAFDEVLDTDPVVLVMRSELFKALEVIVLKATPQ